jgi:SAM-dependent methyltransferase
MTYNYTRSPAYYDAISDAQGKDYAREAGLVLTLIKQQQAGAWTLCDVACGTGRHLEYFAEKMECVGVDLDPYMLGLAAARCGGVELIQGDMRSLELEQRFDVVTCLFSAIGYARNESELSAAVGAMAGLLNQGGLLIIEPWVQSEEWDEGRVSLCVADTGELKVVRMDLAERDGERAVLNFHFLVGRRGEVESFFEQHVLTLFSWAQYEAAFASAGLSMAIDKVGISGRGLLVGQAR